MRDKNLALWPQRLYPFHSRIARVLFLSALRASGCHWPAFPGPDGPGYWLTALRALCVTHHPEGIDWAMMWLKNCGRSGVFSTAQEAYIFAGWLGTIGKVDESRRFYLASSRSSSAMNCSCSNTFPQEPTCCYRMIRPRKSQWWPLPLIIHDASDQIARPRQVRSRRSPNQAPSIPRRQSILRPRVRTSDAAEAPCAGAVDRGLRH